jgi:hypothetical protein
MQYSDFEIVNYQKEFKTSLLGFFANKNAFIFVSLYSKETFKLLLNSLTLPNA